MSRSIKKGPFIQPVLLKRVQEMNAKARRKSSRRGPARPPSSRISSGTRLPSTTAASMFRST